MTVAITFLLEAFTTPTLNSSPGIKSMNGRPSIKRSCLGLLLTLTWIPNGLSLLALAVIPFKIAILGLSRDLCSTVKSEISASLNFVKSAVAPKSGQSCSYRIDHFRDFARLGLCVFYLIISNLEVFIDDIEIVAEPIF